MKKAPQLDKAILAKWKRSMEWGNAFDTEWSSRMTMDEKFDALCQLMHFAVSCADQKIEERDPDLERRYKKYHDYYRARKRSS
jgi:hypothetical protein